MIKNWNRTIIFFLKCGLLIKIRSVSLFHVCLKSLDNPKTLQPAVTIHFKAFIIRQRSSCFREKKSVFKKRSEKRGNFYSRSGLRLYCSAYSIYSFPGEQIWIGRSVLDLEGGFLNGRAQIPLSRRWERLWRVSLKIGEVINVPAGWQIQSSRIRERSCDTHSHTLTHSQIQSLIANCSTMRCVLVCTDSCHAPAAALLWWFS